MLQELIPSQHATRGFRKIVGLCWGSMGIMEKKMETTILGLYISIHPISPFLGAPIRRARMGQVEFSRTRYTGIVRKVLVKKGPLGMHFLKRANQKGNLHYGHFGEGILNNYHMSHRSVTGTFSANPKT